MLHRLLVNNINLARRLDDVPFALEPGRDDEVVARLQFGFLAGRIAQYRAAAQDLAKLVFGVLDLPATRLRLPNAGKKPVVATGEVVPRPLHGLAADTFLRGRFVFAELRFVPVEKDKVG